MPRNLLPAKGPSQPNPTEKIAAIFQTDRARMWVKPTPGQARSVVSQLQRQGGGDCVLVSSQCGGKVTCHSLLLSLHSPFLAELLEEGGQVQGLTLPLTLPAIQGLVKLLEGGDWPAAPVEQVVTEAADILGIHLEALDRENTLKIGELFSLQANSTDIKMEPVDEVDESTGNFEDTEIKMKPLDSTEKFTELEAIKESHLNTDLQAASPIKRPKRTHTSPSPIKSGDNKTCKWTFENGQICGKVFTKTNNLTAHMRMHQDIRPFPCSICEQTFRQKAHLQRHEGRHHIIHSTAGRKKGLEEEEEAVYCNSFTDACLGSVLKTEADCEAELDPMVELQGREEAL